MLIRDRPSSQGQDREGRVASLASLEQAGVGLLPLLQEPLVHCRLLGEVLAVEGSHPRLVLA